jgi:hypothetical protein
VTGSFESRLATGVALAYRSALFIRTVCGVCRHVRRRLRLRTHLGLRVHRRLRCMKLRHRLRYLVRHYRRMFDHMTWKCPVMSGHGQMAFMMRHDYTQLFAAMEHFGAAVSVTVEIAVTHAVMSNVPDVRGAPDENNVRIHDRADVHIARSGDIFRLDNNRGDSGASHIHCRRRHRLIGYRKLVGTTRKSQGSGKRQSEFKGVLLVQGKLQNFIDERPPWWKLGGLSLA